MFKNQVVKIMLFGALLAPMAQASPDVVHTVNLPQIWFQEPQSDNDNDPPKYRDGYKEEEKPQPKAPEQEEAPQAVKDEDRLGK
jgi:hypothetical protein